MRPGMTKIVAIAGCAAVAVSAIAYSIAIYESEAARQETARMQICITGGGKWVTAWNWRTYCSVP